MVEQGASFGARALQLFAPEVGREISGFDHFQGVQAGEGFGAGADEQHVRGFFHHRARGVDRMFDASDAGHRARAQPVAVHHRGIEFVRLVAGEHRAVAGVEQRAVLEQADRQGDRVERAAAFGEAALAGNEDVVERGVVGVFLGIADQTAAQGAGAAVDGDDGGRKGRAHGVALREGLTEG